MTNITSDDFNRLYEQYKKICGNPIPTREDKEKRLEFIQKLNELKFREIIFFTF